jgi:hypothetical protein
VYGPQALVGDAWVWLTLFGLISGSGLMALSGRRASQLQHDSNRMAT